MMKDRFSKVVDILAARLPSKPAAYLFLLLVWLVTLWFLSEGHPTPENAPSFLHLDKIAHFGYFFGGGGLLAAWLGLRQRMKSPDRPLRNVFFIVLLAGCVIGRLDEYHQSFTPGRSGNDGGDWLADILGAATGAWVMLCLVLPRLVARQNQAAGRGDREIVANSLD